MPGGARELKKLKKLKKLILMSETGTGDDRRVPNFEVRNRLRIAHEHAAAALHRAAMIHEEAAGYWEQVHEPDKADDHWQLAASSVKAAKEHEALAARFAGPSERQAQPLDR